ncbi:MAG: hypothetical protein ACTSPF_06465 [Candidatus Heimdallarchaeaceae archaeon]
MKKSSRKFSWMIFFFLITVISSAFTAWNALANDNCPIIYMISLPFLGIFGILFLVYLLSWIEVLRQERESDGKTTDEI